MKRRNSFVHIWFALVLVVLAVREGEGAIGSITSSSRDSNPPSQATLSHTACPSRGAGSTGNMLQFRAGGHVLGFQPRKVFLAGLDHALSIEFLGTAGVMPTSTQASADTGKSGKAPPLSTVIYRNLWEGIDLTYESAEGGIAESTYHVAPGADPSKIQLRYNVPVELQGDGSLKLNFASGTLIDSPPVAWQEIEGKRVPVKAEFRVAGNDVGFAVGPYDRSQALIIDPTYKWHAFYGSSSTHDYGADIAVDDSGNIYVLGVSYRNLPSVTEYSLFVIKLDSSGAFQWQYSCGNVVGRAIAVDANSNVYVTGNTPISNDPVDLDTDIFVLKLNGTGVLQWSQFCGSSDPIAPYDYGYDIAVDGSGHIYVTGMSGATWGSPLHAHSGGNDIVVLKLDGSGTYQWHTFYGPGNGLSIAADAGGNLYVTGDSPDTWGSPLHAHSGSPPGNSGYTDIVVLKLDSSGSYQWHTFYGSNYHDRGDAIAVDGNGSVYVRGESDVTWGSPLHAHSSDSCDNYVLKLDGTGAYQWHTFYGSANDIALDSTANIYVTTGPGVGVMKLDGHGAFQWQASYGTGGSAGITLDTKGNVYVTGSTSDPWGSPLHAYSDGLDLVVVKIAQFILDSPDTDGDGRADILWRHAPTGTIYSWLMNGMSVSTQGTLGTVLDSNWHIEKMGDFNGDGRSDILWRHADGTLYSWLMDGVTTIGAGSLGTVDPSWSVVGVGDLGGDGKADILWRHTSGAMYLWEMDGMFALKAGHIASVGPSWGVDAVADFNNDGKADILWRNTSGVVYLWLMDGATLIGEGSPGTVDLSWSIVSAGDFTSDGKADILWRHTSGTLVIWEMDGTTRMNVRVLGTVDPSWSIADAHDFNGDGKADILWRHTSGATYLWLMNGFTVVGGGSLGVVDPSWSIENR